MQVNLQFMGEKMQIEVRGRIYASTFEAAQDLGVRVERVREARRSERLKMIEIRGQQFDSVKSVAEFFGMNSKSVRKQIRIGRAQTIGLKKKGTPREPFTIRGEVFTTTRDAAERFNVTTTMVAQAIRQGRLDYVGKPKFQRRPITIDGVTYHSRFAAARAIGLSYQKVRYQP